MDRANPPAGLWNGPNQKTDCLRTCFRAFIQTVSVRHWLYLEVANYLSQTVNQICNSKKGSDYNSFVFTALWACELMVPKPSLALFPLGDTCTLFKNYWKLMILCSAVGGTSQLMIISQTSWHLTTSVGSSSSPLLQTALIKYEVVFESGYIV